MLRLVCAERMYALGSVVGSQSAPGNAYTTAVCVMPAQVGLGGPVLLQGAKRGSGLTMRMTNGILLLGAATVRADAHLPHS